YPRAHRTTKQLRKAAVVGSGGRACAAHTPVDWRAWDSGLRARGAPPPPRHKIDWEFGLRRLEHAGVVVSSAESALFEWTERSDHPEFKTISEIVKSLSKGS